MRRPCGCVLMLFLGACSAAGGGTATGGGGGLAAPSGLFEKLHPWNTDVSTSTKSPRSDAITAALSRSGGWGNGDVLQADFSFALSSAEIPLTFDCVRAP